MAPGITPRTVFIDAAPFTGRSDGESVVYDLDAVLKPVSSSGMRQLPEWAVGVRLVLSEVGADRVLDSQYGLIEAMGVLETVRNRMDPAMWNPDGIVGLRPFPGCDSGASFASCANPQQYYGMARDRALNPARAYPRRDMLLSAIDVAVSAWWLLDTHVVADVTNGATSFHHACGGAAYGQPRDACDGSGSDVPGANGVTGPIVFSGPTAWLKSQGRYDMGVTRRIDYWKGLATDLEPGQYAHYLWGQRDSFWVDADFHTDPAELKRLWRDASVSTLVDSAESDIAP